LPRRREPWLPRCMAVTYVLGVGAGLGAALCRRFASAGHAIALMARNEQTVAPIVAELSAQGTPAYPFEVDATTESSVVQGFQAAADTVGPADVLIYNAGAFQMGGILETSAEDFERCFRANCMGAFLSAKCVLPHMLAEGRGTLLFTGATASLRGGARFASLAVGKFGLRALSQSLAREFQPAGVHVAHVVIDGQIHTPRQRAMFPERDPATLLAADAIAEAYYQLYVQPPSCWTLELDLRPHTEKF
jgi:NAD(P)-dependent dehydrogenase (short-subunit alcohol dehydrogenase family)